MENKKNGKQKASNYAELFKDFTTVEQANGWFEDMPCSICSGGILNLHEINELKKWAKFFGIKKESETIIFYGSGTFARLPGSTKVYGKVIKED